MNNLDKGRGSERERELDRLCFEPGVEKKKRCFRREGERSLKGREINFTDFTVLLRIISD